MWLFLGGSSREGSSRIYVTKPKVGSWLVLPVDVANLPQALPALGSRVQDLPRAWQG